jgi:phosphoribosylanthranilate isomerase
MGTLARADGGPLVKICGLRRDQDIAAAYAFGADLIGLVFAPSKRRVTADEALALLAHAPHPPAVGLFVDAAPAEVAAVSRATGLGFVQLCGRESPEQAEAAGVPYFKTMHLAAGDTAEAVLAAMARYRGAAGFVLDSPSPQGGGSGKVADWALAAAVARSAARPVLLAGGLTPANVAEGLRATGAAGVDVSSGVERDGWKDPALIEAFVRAARGPSLAHTRDRAANGDCSRGRAYCSSHEDLMGSMRRAAMTEREGRERC